MTQLSAGELPPIWQTANLSTASAADKALFSTLNATIPNIAPRGDRSGNFTGGQSTAPLTACAR